MQPAALVLLVVAALSSSACFQMTTIVSVKGDGSGTIDHTLVVTKAALAQLRQFAALSGGRRPTLDLISEDQARSLAESLGQGVTYVSSTAIDTPVGEGRRATYAFSDITQIRISERPKTNGLSIQTESLKAGSGEITCAFSRDANGNAVLRINLPELSIPGTLGDAQPGSASLAQQLAMVRMLLAGARIWIAVEPSGQLVRTTSPYVDAPSTAGEPARVTLLDVNLDQLLGNEAVIARVQAAKNYDELKAALKDVDGLKITLDREVTIEFTPK